jgi:hypothetical protein
MRVWRGPQARERSIIAHVGRFFLDRTSRSERSTTVLNDAVGIHLDCMCSGRYVRSVVHASALAGILCTFIPSWPSIATAANNPPPRLQTVWEVPHHGIARFATTRVPPSRLPSEIVVIEPSDREMWKIASAARFKQAVSWISAAAIFGATANFATAALFEKNRSFRLTVGLVILLLAIIARRAGRNFDTNPLRAAQTIEKVLYAVAVTSVLAGAYVIWAEEALRSVPGLLLVLVNGLIGLGAFAVVSPKSECGFAMAMAIPGVLARPADRDAVRTKSCRGDCSNRTKTPFFDSRIFSPDGSKIGSLNETKIRIIKAGKCRMSMLYDKLSDWSGTSTLLLSTLEFSIGFVSALALCQLFLSTYAALVGRAGSDVSSWHLSLLFACATWSIFLALLTVKPEQLLQGFDAIRVIAGASVVVAPISIVAGIPTFLIYVLRKPVAQSRSVYLAATAITVTSYLYLVWLEQASRNS